MLRVPWVRRYLQEAQVLARRGEDSRDGPPWGWQEVYTLLRRLDEEARTCAQCGQDKGAFSIEPHSFECVLIHPAHHDFVSAS